MVFRFKFVAEEQLLLQGVSVLSDKRICDMSRQFPNAFLICLIS